MWDCIGILTDNSIRIEILQVKSNQRMMKEVYRFALLGALCVLLSQAVLADDDDAKAKKDSVGTVIGIDLGTTYSV